MVVPAVAGWYFTEWRRRGESVEHAWGLPRLAANVLRWRRQLSLPEVPEAELVASARPIEGAGDGAVVVDLENGDRGLSGAVVPRDGKWFFYKLTGPVAAVKAAREAFLNYAKAKKP
jgi:hypothetical protein